MHPSPPEDISLNKRLEIAKFNQSKTPSIVYPSSKGIFALLELTDKQGENIASF